MHVHERLYELVDVQQRQITTPSERKANPTEKHIKAVLAGICALCIVHCIGHFGPINPEGVVFSW